VKAGKTEKNMNGERILLGDIARKLGGAVVGDSAAEVTRPASPTGARAGDICAVWEVGILKKSGSVSNVLLRLMPLPPGRN
jgi:hypothetical protein